MKHLVGARRCMASLMGLAVAAGCTRINPAFSSMLTDGRPGLEVGAGSDGAGADRSDVAAEMPGSEAGAAGAPTLRVGSPSTRPWYGGTGGVEHLGDRCPAGQVVIGHQGSISDENTFVGRLQIQCGTLRVTRTEPPFMVEVTPGALLAARGTTTGAPWTASCPANQVVVRYAGQAADYVESLRTRCAQLEVTADRTGIGPVAHQDLPAYGSGTASAFEEDCEALGQVVIGADTRTGGWLDAIRPTCAPITVVP
jgi:hypothetical protein